MRPFNLLRIALEAEILRLSHQGRRAFFRALLACCALVLLFAALVFGHIAAWFWLRSYMAGQYVGLIFAGTDLLLAAILATIAARSTPGRVELEALNLRRSALDDAAASLTMSALVMRVLEMVLSARRRK